MSDKIAAIATGRARTGIGILRLSGDGCIEAAGQVFRLNSGRPLSSLPDRKLSLGTLFDAQGRPVDHCMAFISRAPHSYTGEDTAEIQCHGSPAALTAGLEALFAAGFRQARPGEFTRRALNRARRENARTGRPKRHAVVDGPSPAGQVAGAIRKKIDPIYDGWVDLCAHFHAVLDYPDEDIDPFSLSGYEASLTDSSRQLTALLASCHRGRMVQSGIKAVILGSPNAGKSSLLNRLSGFDRVIVTDIPGTTRDTVEQTVTLGRHLVRLVDTAGIRDTQDVIEKIGVDRSMEAVKDCDAALFVVDDSKPLTDEDRRAMDAALEAPEAIAILNKQDLAAVIEPSDLPFSYIIPVSCKDGTGFDLLEQAFDMLFPDDTPCDGSLLTNARQADAILRAKKSVDSAVRSLRAGMTPDAVLVDLEAAMDALGEVTGRTMREDITNRIFERFCVGK